MRTLTEKKCIDGNFLLPPERLAMRASEGRTAAVLLELLVLGVLIITSIHTHTECESYSFAYTREANEHGERAKAHTPLGIER